MGVCVAVGAGCAAGVGEGTAGVMRGAGVGSGVGCDAGVGLSAVAPTRAGVAGTGLVAVGTGVEGIASVAAGGTGVAVRIVSSSDPQATSATVAKATARTKSARLGNFCNRTEEIDRRGTPLILAMLPAFQHGQQLSNRPNNSAR